MLFTCHLIKVQLKSLNLSMKFAHLYNACLLTMGFGRDYNKDLSKENSKPITDSLKIIINLNISNDKNERITKYETTIDAVY